MTRWPLSFAVPAVLLAVQTGFAATPAGVPFRYVHRELVVRAMLNGRGPFDMLLDTDTTPSVIDAALVRSLHVPIVGAGGHGEGLGTDKTTAYPIRVASLAVGPAHATNLDALSLDIGSIAKKMRLPIRGILGTSFFAHRVVEIDYPRRRLKFLADAALLPITARFADPERFITNDAYANGVQVTAVIDTGNSSIPFLSRRGIARIRYAHVAGKPSTAYGYNGATRQSSGLLRDLRLGNVDFGASAIHVNPSAAGPYQINIGNASLERYVVTIDAERRLLMIRQAARRR